MMKDTKKDGSVLFLFSCFFFCLVRRGTLSNPLSVEVFIANLFRVTTGGKLNCNGIS